MRRLPGDLLDVALPAIAHGCNTSGSMGGGVARQLRDRYPALHAEYLERCAAGRFRLGDAWAWTAPDGHVVYNLATQVRPGADARLDGIRVAVAAMLLDAAERGLDEIGLPRLGAGIGGLRWADVRGVLAELEAGSAVRLVVVERRQVAERR